MSAVGDHSFLLVPEQFPTIQKAVDAVPGPATIIVSAGVYPESVDVFEKDYLVIQSAQLFRRGVTLFGDGPGPSSILSVRKSTLHLSGIELRSNAALRGLTAVDSAISLQECVVAGNRITGNTVDLFGAGMCCHNSAVRIQKCAIIGNTIDARTETAAAGGGLYFHNCKIEIAGTTIQANAVYAAGEARGGGIWCEQSKMRMWRSRVTDNETYAAVGKGGGIYFKRPEGCQLGGSVITGNGCPGGIGGGILVDGERAGVAIHRNTVVRHNNPNDVEFC